MFCLVTAGVGALIGAGIAAYKSYQETGEIDVGSVITGAVVGGLVGLGAGAAAATVLAGSATASCGAVVAGVKATVVVTASSISAAVARGWGSLQKAAEYGIQTYSQLKNAIAGKGLQAHHIIEQRFAKILGITNTNGMKAVALTPEEHQAFTNAWRALIPYGDGTKNVNTEQILEAAKQIYKEFPELLKAALEQLGK